jgi:hypothetical protein
MTRVLAVIVASALTANCATGAYNVRRDLIADNMTPSVNGERNGASGARAPEQDPPGVTAAYVKAMTLGARIAVTTTDGKRMKGTLMMVHEDAIVVRPRTRVPEPAQTIPMAQIATIETEREGGMGRAIAIGAAVGAGAALGVFLALIVAMSD